MRRVTATGASGLSRLLWSTRAFLVAPSVALFLVLFASQAGLLVLSPILVEVADDFGVSIAAAGQLRTITGLVAGASGLALGRFAGRFALRDLLIGGTLLLAAGSAMSAVAPTFWFLALAQAPTGVAIGILLAAGVTGAAEWASPSERGRVLSWALIGQAAAWIVGMPTIGALADVSWRLGFALPFAATLITACVLALCAAGPPATATAPGLRALLRDRVIGGWFLGELLAFSAWTGTLIYSGALLIESYEASPLTAGIVLAAGAVAYVPGTLLARRLLRHAAARSVLISAALAAAVGAAVFGGLRPALALSAVVFGALGFLGGMRTYAGSSFGLDVAGDRKLAVMSLRAAALQFGYLGGSLAGGIALAASGYGALGLTFALLFVGAATVHLALTRRATQPV